MSPPISSSVDHLKLVRMRDSSTGQFSRHLVKPSSLAYICRIMQTKQCAYHNRYKVLDFEKCRCVMESSKATGNNVFHARASSQFHFELESSIGGTARYCSSEHYHHFQLRRGRGGFLKALNNCLGLLGKNSAEGRISVNKSCAGARRTVIGREGPFIVDDMRQQSGRGRHRKKLVRSILSHLAAETPPALSLPTALGIEKLVFTMLACRSWLHSLSLTLIRLSRPCAQPYTTIL
jgi:hypothetical protein